jgi:hypothetical protein
VTPIVVVSLATFIVLFAWLTYRLGTGHDPALSKVAAATRAPRQVVVKRIEHHVVVTKLVPPRRHRHRSRALATTPAPSAAPAAPSQPVAVQPPPAPAPAPAPAPITTKSS